MVNKLTMISALEPFLTRPVEKIHLSQVARILDAPRPTVRLWLNSLQKKGVLKKTKEGVLALYQLNLDDLNTIDYLVMAEKEKLIRHCAQDLVFKNLVRAIHESLGEKNLCVVFGSSAENSKIANDVDLLIVGKVETTNIRKVATRLDKKLHIIEVSSLSKVTKSLKEEIIKKHFLIRGSEQVWGWMSWSR